MKQQTPLENEWQWYKQDVVKKLLAREIVHVQRLLPARYYAYGLQIGLPGESSYFGLYCENFRLYLEKFETGEVKDESAKYAYTVKSLYHQIPLSKTTADLIIMPHSLDLSHHPVEILREVSQIIDNDGILVITGFNPMSLIGLGKFISRKIFNKNIPTNHTPRKIKEWLKLIGFEICGSCYLDYLPLVQNLKVTEKLKFLDRAGERWWPLLGGIYVIVAKKNVIQLEKMSILTSIKKSLNSTIIRPVTQKNG